MRPECTATIVTSRITSTVTLIPTHAELTTQQGFDWFSIVDKLSHPPAVELPLIFF